MTEQLEVRRRAGLPRTSQWPMDAGSRVLTEHHVETAKNPVLPAHRENGVQSPFTAWAPASGRAGADPDRRAKAGA